MTGFVYVLRTAAVVGSIVLLAPAAAAQDAPSVVVKRVAERDVTPQFEYVGRVEAVETVELRARVEGFLEKREFREGAEIDKGVVLFSIEKAPYQVTVQKRTAELAAAQAEAKNLEADFKRKSALVKRGDVAVATLDQARASLASGQANVLIAEAELRKAKLDLSYTDILSPIAGKISRTRYNVGSLVGPSSEPLATVTSVDPVYVVIGVSEKQLINSRKRGIDLDNPPVAPSLVLSDGSKYPRGGKFDYLAPSVDQTTDTVVARAVFANPDRVLIPGQFVTVVVRQKLAVSKHVLPQSAIQQDSQGYFVLVVDRENKVELRRIAAGRQIETDWVIEDGLASGERVIVQGIQKVRPGLPVNPVEAKPGS